MSEVWKDIEGYEGLYQVSNWGRVKRLEGLDSLGHLRKERIFKSVKNHNGYLYVGLYKDGKCKQHFVHRLVAQAFIHNPDNLPYINHKNEIKDDNNADNLEWCSTAYNCNYGTRNQRIADTKINGKRSKTVYQYTLDGDFVAEYPSVNEIQRQLGFAKTHISDCCLGRYKQSYGFIWRYIKEPQSN